MNHSNSNKSTPWIICKFGGTSVSSKNCWDKIALICQQHIANNLKPLIVCSAPHRISNLLENLIQDATAQSYSDTFTQIEAIYQQLFSDLDLDSNSNSVFDDLLGGYLAQLKQLCEGISLLGEVSMRIHAKILSVGELMLTQLGHAYLTNIGINLHWKDARECLQVTSERNPLQKNYLFGICDSDFDPELNTRLNQIEAAAFITQGFIASNSKKETVLLGRGGSDISAAYFAAKLKAKYCEIWTDVPGIYTANPHLIPEARLLKQLDYDEVQEIASAGAKVLHPNCIAPLKQQQIPLYVKYTKDPEREGTLISYQGEPNKHIQKEPIRTRDTLPIKSIITQYNVMLINIESTNMWQQAGFLADLFCCFKEFDLSVDLISTSETNVTVSLDPFKTNSLDAIDALIEKLKQFGDARLIGPCASISLVGRNIRSILSQISDLFAVFESQQIHLLSQAANDLNLTFVVDEDQAERLAKKLHVILIEQNPKNYYLSKSWLEEFGEKEEIEFPWWQVKRDQLLDVAQKNAPAYIYDHETLEQRAKDLLGCDNINRIFYAIKANPNREILEHFYHLNLNFECVSIHEVENIFNLFPDINPNRILFTPNFASKGEYEKALDLNIHLTIDNLFPLKEWPELFSKKDILIRIDPGKGAGHHKYVCTGGTESKFGIPISQLEAIAALAEQHQINIVGFHAHTGSGILNYDNWYNIALKLTPFLEQFPQVKYLDLGGGLGIVEKPGQKPLDLTQINASLASIKKAYPNLELWMEPGRYLVAEAGVLLAHVTQIKEKNEMTFIGIETGMNSLIRPALYGSYHEIVNLTRLEQPKTHIANIVGPICESGDTLGYSRLMPETQAGDLLLIATAGAYGACMSSHYNLRPPADEKVLF